LLRSSQRHSRRKKNNNKKALSLPLALIETASPDLEKQGFFAVVFVNREYSGEQEPYIQKCAIFLLPTIFKTIAK
jgi:hypothetical protein